MKIQPETFMAEGSLSLRVLAVHWAPFLVLGVLGCWSASHCPGWLRPGGGDWFGSLLVVWCVRQGNRRDCV